MKLNKIKIITIIGGCLLAVSAGAQTMIEGFEYANDTDLQAQWTPGISTLALSANVATDAQGTNSLKIERAFRSTVPWDTEFITGTALTTPISIKPEQYVTLRIAGDPAFANATFQSLFIYAYDSNGNFGRWGAPVPTVSSWQAFNLLASSIAKPWDSPALPDLNDIVKFNLVLYGQGDPAGPDYTATIYVDELQIRNDPLLPPPPPNGVLMVEDYESYTSTDDLLTKWDPYVGTLTLSSSSAPNSKGTNSIKLERFFPAALWEAEVITGPALPAPLAIRPSQFVTLRVAGDPAFTNSSFQAFFVYAYDGSGNFGRWQAAVPTTTNWMVLNMLASSISKPWDSPGLPNLNNIVKFGYVVYGQGDPAGTEFASTIYVDELMIRDQPLLEFPPASPMRAVIDDFEGYANDAALTDFYRYINSPAATATAASLLTPAPQGNKALKLAIDFASGGYPWGSVRSKDVAKFSIPTNGIVQFRFKGDPTLAPFFDDGTSFWLSLYDESGNAIHFTPGEIVTNGNWTTVTATLADFWSDAAVDVGNLVSWRILVQAYEGNTESQAMSGAFYVDDIRVVLQPTTSVVKEGNTLKLQLGNLVPGTTYTVKQSTNLTSWDDAGTIQATGSTATWTVPVGEKGFYRISVGQ